MTPRRRGFPRVGLTTGTTLVVGLALVAGLFAIVLSSGGKAWIKATFAHPLDGAETLDEESAHLIYRWRERPDFVYDPVAFLRPRPNRVKEWRWEEHPSGRLRFQTNDLGMREDGPVPEKRGLRVLVAGDSHTQGLVYNAESFANLLEARLRERDAGCDVLNAGCAYTGPYAYAGVVRKFLDLEPDVFVATLFSGNDFWHDLQVEYILDGWSIPEGGADYHARITEAMQRWSGPVSQGMNQAFRFKRFPAEVDVALRAVVDSYVGMQEFCERRGIRFVALVLPTKSDVDGDDDEGTQTAVRQALGLTPEDVAVNRRLAEAFVTEVRKRGILCVDPTDSMRRAEAIQFWREDYHLSTAGHAVVAQELFSALRADDALGSGR